MSGKESRPSRTASRTTLGPFFCTSCGEGFQADAEWFYRPCPLCGDLSPTTERVIQRGADRVRSYYDTSLGTWIRGDRHRSKVMNERGLVEIGNEAVKVPTPKDKPILTEKEFAQAWREVSSSKSDESGDV